MKTIVENQYWSDFVVSYAAVTTRLSAQHENLLRQKRWYMVCAILAIVITLGIIAVAPFLIAFDPSGTTFYYLVSLLLQPGSLFGVASGSLAGGLIRQCNKLDERIAEVSGKLLELQQLMSAFVACDAIKHRVNRDVAYSKLAKKLMESQSPPTKERPLLDLLERLLRARLKESVPSDRALTLESHSPQ